MEEQFLRSAMLLGESALERLSRARVAVFGLGGVGGYTVEALVRGGVGSLDLIDSDSVNLSNLNRQILATHSTLGIPKVEAAKARVLDINPNCRVTVYPVFYTPETAGQFDFTQYNYIVDAIDTVTGKLALVQQAWASGTPIISCMGTGNKLSSQGFKITDIGKTSGCPLARVMRRELKNRGISHLKVLYSKEKPVDTSGRSTGEDMGARRSLPGSISFVPPVAGLLIAGEVVRELAGIG